MKKILCVFALMGLVFAGTVAYAGEEDLLFGFEKKGGLQGWTVPDWAYESPDYVQKEIAIADEFASEGTSSLGVETEFPGGRWTAIIVEVMEYFDWTDFSKIACDFYVPEDTPRGLKASIILTVGDEWKWVEMSRSYDLKPGKWITITADLKPGSIDWKRVHPDDVFRSDVRKIDIRIFSNNKPAYTGSVYLDNVRVIK